MTTPPYLQKGNTIAIVSTARKISKKELQPALNLLESWGLKAILGKTIGAEENQFAGSDDLRAADFQKMLDDPKIKAIWCARGGYGTVRIIDKLNFSAFKKNPKWIVGYSDVTVLHSHIHNFGIETLHAQMPLEIENKTAETAESIRKVLFGEDYSIEIERTDSFDSLGIVKGELVGGNLSVLYSLCGSNSEMKDNKVYFGKTAEKIIMDLVKQYNYPVISNFPAGHIKDNRALIFGREVELNVQSSIINIQFSSSKNRKSTI